jgi:hypothetical protein
MIRILDYFFGNRWKCENYAPVQAGASLLRSEGVPGDILCTTLATLFESMCFGARFLQIFSDLRSHGVPWVVSGSTFG